MADSRKELLRLQESRWTNPDIDPKKGRYIICGIDVGSVSSQCVIMVDNELYCYGNMRTGYNSPESAVRVFHKATEDTDITLKDIHFTVGTGYGRINVPFGNRAITEIACHAKGANWMYGPMVRTVLDVGGQDCKAIKIDEKGKVVTFFMNDKCAAGAGRGMEVFADLLGIDIEDISEMSMKVTEDVPPLSSTCVVFAKSEALSLLRGGWQKEKVLAAYCSAMADRILSILEKVNVERELAVTGGMAKNSGVIKSITKKLGIDTCEAKWHNKIYAERGYPFDPQIAGAIGAALFSKALAEKKTGSLQ